MVQITQLLTRKRFFFLFVCLFLFCFVLFCFVLFCFVFCFVLFSFLSFITIFERVDTILEDVSVAETSV